MGIEIERKFLVRDETWRALVRGPGTAMRQAYLAAGGPGLPTLRVRLAGDAAWLTIKGPGGLVRAEFEYPIPAGDAAAILALSPLAELGKTRFALEHEGHLWTVDEFHAPDALKGLVLAEVELEAADIQPALPDWLGAEVTDDPRYSNAALAASLKRPD